MSGVSMDLVFDGTTYKAIWDAVMDDPKYRPMHIFFDAPYDLVAFWLEHGTGPAQKGRKESPREDGKTAEQRIGDWTAKRNPGLTKKELKERKAEMYEQIMQTGTPPHPFIRPAAEDLYGTGRADEILSKEGTTTDLAQEFVNLMVDHLRDNRSITGAEGDDSIERHIHFEPYRMDSTEMPDISTGEEIFRDWEILDDMMRSKHAQNLAVYRNRKEKR